MKNIYSTLTGLVLLSILAGSCQKTDKKYTAGIGTFAANALTASTLSPTLSFATEYDTAISFNWSAANFGQQLPITYTLQLDVPSDTAGGWAHAQNFLVGGSMYTYSMIVEALSNAAISAGMTVNVQGVLLVRIKADVLQATGAESSLASAYTNALALTVTPYKLIFYVPNSDQGFNPASAPLLNLVPDSNTKFEGYIYLGTSASPQSFKLTNAPNFLGVDYGDNGSGGLKQAAGTDSAMTVPSGGYYEIQVNTATNTWAAIKTTWAVVGDATPLGWTAAVIDNEMTYDSVNQVWFIDSLSLTTAGSFKFRANNAWNIDFGYGGSGANNASGYFTAPLVYVDNSPFFVYNNQANLTVTTTGIYKVILDLHISGNYTYTLEPQ